jgi:tetratricopeptide (TPR) repeat protein
MIKHSMTILVFAAAFVASAVSAAAPQSDVSGATEFRTGDLSKIWNDPVFQRQFIGGYGVNAEIEPRVTKDEVAILEKVRPLMGGDLLKAEDMMRRLMKPDCSAVLDYTLGGILFQQDKLIDALASFRHAVEKFPTFRRAYRNIGLISIRNQDFEAAIAAFNRMIELGGADAYSYGLLGFAHASRGDFQPAESAYRSALLLQPDNLEWRLGLTRCVFKQGKFDDAASLLDVLITSYPDKADFWLLQAHTYLGMKQPLKAAMNLEAMDSLGKSTVESLYTLGDIYLAENLADLAYSAYSRAVTMNPAQPAARAMRSCEQLASRGGAVQARALVDAVRKAKGESLDDADRRKLLKLDARLAMASGGGTADAAASLEEALRLDPLDGEALMLLAQHYGSSGDPDKAMLYYERAAGIESFAANAKVRHAQILVSQSRFADAIQLLRQAQEIKPREDVARYLEQVERISKAKR